MKIFDSRNNIVIASIGVLLATLALVSCEKREEPLLNEKTIYSKKISFCQVENSTRAAIYDDISRQMPSATYVLHSEQTTDTLILSEYISDLACETQYMTRASKFFTEDLNEFRILAYNVGSNNTYTINELLSKFVGKNSNGTWSYGRYADQDEINWSELGNNTVKFAAYANLPENTNSDEPVISNTGLSSTQFRLNLPTQSNQQRDIVVAVANEQCTSSRTTALPLTFNHILAGVQFQLDGDLEVPGTFTKIEIIDYPSKGAIYDIIEGTWNMDNAAKQNLEFTPTDGNISSDIFMVVPQKMSGSTKFRFTFNSNGLSGQTFDVDLSNVEWSAGKLYTYKVSNSEVTLCNFVNIPEYVDAHYSIVEIDVSSVYGCQISYDATGQNEPNVTFTNSLLDIQDPENENGGYWIKRGPGSGYQNRSTSLEIPFGAQKVFAHIVQNLGASGELRELNIKLKPKTSANSSYSNDEDHIEQKTIKQFEPYWTANNIGCERIEEVSAEMWGPYWIANDDAVTAIYKMSVFGAAVSVIEAVLRGNLGDLIGGNVGFDTDWSSLQTIVTINYTSFLTTNHSNTTSGHTNTYGATGSTTLSAMTAFEEILKQYDSNPTKNFTVVDYAKSAILSSQKKNAYTYTEERGTQIPILADEDKIWFCPSKHECETLKVLRNEYVDGFKRFEDAEDDLYGTYWTSTANINTNATINEEKYTAFDFKITNNQTGEGDATEVLRTTLYKIRACCQLTVPASLN